MATVVAGDGVRAHAEAHGRGIPRGRSPAPCARPTRTGGPRSTRWSRPERGWSCGITAGTAGRQRRRIPTPTRMERVVDDLGRVLDWAAPGEPAVLGGHSFGGLASLHFTLRHPERVRGLLLIDSGPGLQEPEGPGELDPSHRARGLVHREARAPQLRREGGGHDRGAAPGAAGRPGRGGGHRGPGSGGPRPLRAPRGGRRTAGDRRSPVHRRPGAGDRRREGRALPAGRRRHGREAPPRARR